MANKPVPSAQPERLTDDDFETIRIHLSAIKEKLCNQHRWKEAEEYQHIIDRFMTFASAQPERKKGKWIVEGYHPNYLLRCSACQKIAMWAGGISYIYPNFCHNCGSDNREEIDNDDQ